MISSTLAIYGGIYALTGSVAGLIAGTLGIGGGIVIIPALLFIFQHNSAFPPHLIMHMAVGTSLAVMFFTAQASVRAHHQLNGILWDVFKRLLPGLASGIVCGALTASYLSTDLLKILFAIFLIVVGIRLLLAKPSVHTPSSCLGKPLINTVISFLIGFTSGLLGVGGGSLVIPYLNYCGVEMRKAVAISALVTVIVALLGTFIFIIMGLKENSLPLYSTGYIYWPAVFCLALLSSVFAPLGAKITYRISVRQLQYAFVLLLFIVAMELLF
ncbi:permease [Legionella lansingensis]|uniref:Probable membrane transporter protein n=1 Tax=Legionella lansingensis TaxID=45067 RepID=A0A0W0VL98_9GAMM|nr:sulfite exporter TauE/SafE family protein [Legionella lansingensis]KTD20891.1 permease [Legionella lansingensis]SNV43816.1 permease [Legionella lansingensis]